ncbi:MAG: DNA replication and repair protein RecF [Chloroflexi bacterium]|nr:DNA replication and repair protein RecF [Chloroflexota bacterium]
MRVRTLSLEEFRGYEHLSLELSGGITAFVGPNGVGKTNLLEAVHLIARGDSPRAHDDSELIRWGAPLARVGVRVARAEDERRVEILLFNAADGERRRPRRYLVNGAGKRVEDALGEATVVAFFPEDVELLTAAPAVRRRYLDAMVGQVDRAHRASTREYARVLEQRNALLRALRDGESTEAEMAFWDVELCRLAALISSARIAAIAQLVRPFGEAMTRFSGADDLALAYLGQVEGTTSGEREPGYRALVREKAERERWQGTSLVGPHREDLGVSAQGRALGTFASRGEQRSAVLALKVAEAAWLRDQRGESPIFLLDDVLSELDPDRREALISSIPLDAQALLTAAVPASLPRQLVERATTVRVPFGP